ATPVTAPEGALGERETRTTARGADPLVVFGSVTGDLVTKAEFLLHLHEVLDMHQRREGMPAAPAVSLGAFAADVLVETDTELRGSLKDVEELSERHPQEGADHRDRMEDCDERVSVTLHPAVARREHQSREAHREQEDQR